MSMIERFKVNFNGFTDRIRETLIESPFINTDETGMKVGKKRFQLHVTSIKLLTLFGIFGSRGHTGIEALGLLPNYFGFISQISLQSWLLQCSFSKGTQMN